MSEDKVETPEAVDVDALVEEVSDPNIQKIADLELKLQHAKTENSRINKTYKKVKEQHNELLTQLDLLEDVGMPTMTPIRKKKPKGDTEATIVITLSDWHFEENVDPETVNGLNEYNIEIAEYRTEKLFQSGLRLTEIIAKDVNVTTILMPLLGDFITNDIHDEFRDTNNLLPMEAMMAVQDKIASGIKFFLQNTKYNLELPCHSGNHGRTTKVPFIGSEYGHSLEYFMYRNLEKLFKKEQRVKFDIVKGYHSYKQVYDMTLRFHHGHALRYHGGVGGIFIPAYKAIAQWNKAKHADLDVFGHFHQMKDGGSFISNGSVIGYNPFAIKIKADYEPPRQAFFVIDSKRGKTFVCPIRMD
jgi:hypothetical protein